MKKLFASLVLVAALSMTVLADGNMENPSLNGNLENPSISSTWVGALILVGVQIFKM